MVVEARALALLFSSLPRPAESGGAWARDGRQGGRPIRRGDHAFPWMTKLMIERAPTIDVLRKIGVAS